MAVSHRDFPRLRGSATTFPPLNRLVMRYFFAVFSTCNETFRMEIKYLWKDCNSHIHGLQQKGGGCCARFLQVVEGRRSTYSMDVVAEMGQHSYRWFWLRRHPLKYSASSPPVPMFTNEIGIVVWNSLSRPPSFPIAIVLVNELIGSEFEVRNVFISSSRFCHKISRDLAQSSIFIIVSMIFDEPT